MYFSTLIWYWLLKSTSVLLVKFSVNGLFHIYFNLTQFCSVLCYVLQTHLICEFFPLFWVMSTKLFLLIVRSVTCMCMSCEVFVFCFVVLRLWFQPFSGDSDRFSITTPDEQVADCHCWLISLFFLSVFLFVRITIFM